MTKNCSYCGLPISDNERIVAVVVSVYHAVPSSVAFAIEKPTDCLEIQHLQCAKTDWYEEIESLEGD